MTRPIRQSQSPSLPFVLSLLLSPVSGSLSALMALIMLHAIIVIDWHTPALSQQLEQQLPVQWKCDEKLFN